LPMMLVVCRSECEKILDATVEILDKLGIRDVEPYYSEVPPYNEDSNWFGITLQRCQRYNPDDEEYEGDVRCEAEVIRQSFTEILEATKRLASEFGDSISFIFITSAPSLNAWGATIAEPGAVYATWVNSDIPQRRLEIRLYMVFLLNLVMQLDPAIALRSSVVPFICVECLAEDLRAKGLKVESVGRGYLFIA